MSSYFEVSEGAKLFLAAKRENWSAISDKLKAIFHPERLQIIRGLVSAPSGSDGVMVKDMWMGLNVTQAAVSQHLKVLRDSGIVGSIRKGSSMLYFMKDPEVAEWMKFLKGKIEDSPAPPEDAQAPAPPDDEGEEEEEDDEGEGEFDEFDEFDEEEDEEEDEE